MYSSDIRLNTKTLTSMDDLSRIYTPLLRLIEMSIKEVCFMPLLCLFSSLITRLQGKRFTRFRSSYISFYVLYTA